MRIKSVNNISFVGDCARLCEALSRPFSNLKYENSFCYKSCLYRFVEIDDSCTRVVVFSVTDMLIYFDDMLALANAPKNILFITDYRLARKMGLKINKRKLRYLLPCPVVFDKKYSSWGINKLLELIHIVSSTPDYSSACNEPFASRHSVLSIKQNHFFSLFSKMLNIV